MSKTTSAFTSEADLCAAFIEWAKPQGWTAYAETSGWDILMVNPAGEQIGVQAKMRFNPTLLRQVLPTNMYCSVDVGPDYRAILLPSDDREIGDVCAALGITYFRPYGRSYQLHEHGYVKHRDDRFIPAMSYATDRAGVWVSDRRHELPGYVPDVVAGASGPVQLTKWKVGALRLCARLEIRGYLTREDFHACGIDHRRWVPSQWLKVEDGRYVRGERLAFDRQHPTNYASILADERTILPSLPLTPPVRSA